jgi:hypothetical protein
MKEDIVLKELASRDFNLFFPSGTAPIFILPIPFAVEFDLSAEYHFKQCC